MSDPPDPTVDWQPGAVTVAGAWTYRFDTPCHPRVHPLRAPSGAVLTTDAPPDHPWHHGLWFTIKFVDGINFWEELGGHGVLVHRDDPAVVAGEAPWETAVAGWVDWVEPDGVTVPLRQLCRLSHRHLDPDAYALDVSVRLQAKRDVMLDREPFNGLWGGYSGLTFRGRPDFVDTVITLADGVRDDRVLGERSPWLALDGTVRHRADATGEERAEAGIVMMDDPANMRHPVPWYASTRAATYGDDGWSNFANAALLWDEPLPLTEGQELGLRYRVVVHDGRWDSDRIEQAWHSWRADLVGRGAP